MEIFIIQFFSPRALQNLFKSTSTFFRLLVSQVLDNVLCFILGREFCDRNLFVFLKFLENYVWNTNYQGKINKPEK